MPDHAVSRYDRRASTLASADRPDADWRHDVDVYGQKYRDNPSDPATAVRYAQALRATGQRAQAVAILEQISMQNPHNKLVLGEYGRALAEAGQYEQALEVFDRAHTPEQPDWHILSAQGAVLDQMGRHEEAQRHYLTALKIVPDEPSVLSNLGLSYALSKDLKNAEATLRRAAAHRSGRSARAAKSRAGRRTARPLPEAEDIARADLPPDQAAANVAYLRQMLAHKGDVPLADRAAHAMPGSSS